MIHVPSLNPRAMAASNSHLFILHSKPEHMATLFAWDFQNPKADLVEITGNIKTRPEDNLNGCIATCNATNELFVLDHANEDVAQIHAFSSKPPFKKLASFLIESQEYSGQTADEASGLCASKDGSYVLVATPDGRVIFLRRVREEGQQNPAGFEICGWWGDIGELRSIVFVDDKHIYGLHSGGRKVVVFDQKRCKVTETILLGGEKGRGLHVIENTGNDGIAVLRGSHCHVGPALS